MASILRVPQVVARTGLSRTTIHLRVKAGTFPAPFSLGARAVGWLDTAVDRWIADRAATGAGPTPTKALASLAAQRKAKNSLSPAA